MRTYTIRNFNQKRSVVFLFSLPIAMIFSIFLSIELDSVIYSVIFLLLFIFVFFHLVVGKISINISNDKIYFKWLKKPIFMRKLTTEISISDITELIIDDEKILRKIKTKEQIIRINNWKFDKNESPKLIRFLKKRVKNQAEIIDSWDEFAKLGYLKMVYKINIFIIIVSIASVIFVGIVKEFKASMLLVFFLFIPQIFLYQKQIKSKLKK